MANFIDSVVGYLNPNAGFKRVRARTAIDEIERYRRKHRLYEGASRNRRLKNWFTGSNGPNKENDVSIHTLRDRARDLVRNNPYAARGLQAITSNVIGEGIVPAAKPNPLLKKSNAEIKKAEIADQLWGTWAETTLCDYDEKLNIYGLQNLIMRTIAQDGECLIRKVIDPLNPSGVPLRIKIMEADYIDTLKGSEKGGNKIVNGIEYDKAGKKVAYWLFSTHPGELEKASESLRVLAAEVLHPFRVDRAQQNRGVTWYSSVIVRLRGLDEYEDAQLVRQKIAACFAAFVTKNDDLGSDEVSTQERIEPGLVSRLSPGESISFSNPPSVDGYRDFTSVGHRGVAAGLGITYESLTGDLTNTSFSSGRLGWAEMFRNVRQWRVDIIEPQVMTPLWLWFTEAATAGKANILGVGVKWTPPKREPIDPIKDVEAASNKVRAGFSTVSEEILSLGGDPIKVFQERSDELKKFDELGIFTSSDPRKDKGIVDKTQGGNFEIENT